MLEKFKHIIAQSRHSARTGAISVSGLAKAAGVSRSTIYRYYPSIVAELKTPKATQPKCDAMKLSLLKKRLRSEKETTAALARQCAELLIELEQLKENSQCEITALKLQIDGMTRRAKGGSVVRILKPD